MKMIPQLLSHVWKSFVHFENDIFVILVDTQYFEIIIKAAPTTNGNLKN